jgi:hypothetical protein
MIPKFNGRGSLPPGVNETTMAEMEDRLAFNEHRKVLVEGLKRVVENLRLAGVRRLWVDGSFVTNKPYPGDIDGCWESAGVDPDLLDPVLLDFEQGRAAMKEKFGVDFFPNVVEGATGKIFYRFFQYDRNQAPRGILLLKLRR